VANLGETNIENLRMLLDFLKWGIHTYPEKQVIAEGRKVSNEYKKFA